MLPSKLYNAFVVNEHLQLSTSLYKKAFSSVPKIAYCLIYDYAIKV